MRNKSLSFKTTTKKYECNCTCSTKMLSRHLKYSWSSFAQKTSVHGMKHLLPDKWKSEKDTSRSRKILWLLLILVSLVCFIATLEENLDRYFSYPTSTNSYTETKSKIQFPYVLLCPTNQFHTYYFKKIGWISELYQDLIKMNLRNALPLRQYQTLTDVEADLLGLLKCYKKYLTNYNQTHNCDNINDNFEDNIKCFCENSKYDFCYNKTNSTELYQLINEMDLIINKTLSCTTLDKLLYDLHYKPDRTVFYCSYKNKAFWSNCTGRFKTVHTYYGYCMIFNASNYFLENPKNDDKFIFEAGSNADLSIGMYFNSENVFGDSTADNIGIGVKVGIIQPDRHDGHIITETTLSAPAGFTTNIALTPKKLTFLSKANYRRFQVECIDESNIESVKLKYFETYDPTLCKLECLIDRIYKKFSCKPFYAPESAPGSFCSFLLRPLLWRFMEEHEGGKIFESPSNSTNQTYQCRPCPNLCKHTIYDIEISSIVYPSMFYFTKLVETDVLNLKNETFERFSRNRLLLNIYFKNMMINVQVEKQEFTFIALLSSIGGFIGLFLGASILSIFEFFEFLVSIFIPKRIQPSK
jgi:hypothetical protein